MSNKNEEVEKEIQQEDVIAENNENVDAKAETEKEDVKEENAKASKKSKKTKAKKEDKVTELGNKLAEINDKYLRLSAEFDNYRKRTLKEKMDLIKTGGESTLLAVLPVYDDFERALQNMETAKDVEKLKEGVQLIYNKFTDFLNSNGIKAIEAKDMDFDTELHEAITKFPVQDKKQKGKVIDVMEKGYKLHDKVIRFAKVVVGE